MPSSYVHTKGGMSNDQNEALIERAADIKNYVNNLGGSLIVLGQAGLWRPYGFFPLALQFTTMDFVDNAPTDDMRTISPDTNDKNLDHVYWHGYFTGPKDWSGIYRVLAYKKWVRDNWEDGHGCPIPNGARF